MIAVLKNTATKEQIANLVSWFENKGLKVNESKGEYCTVLGLIGDTSTIDINLLQGLDIIERLSPLSAAFFNHCAATLALGFTPWPLMEKMPI